MLYWIELLKKLTNEQVAENPKRSVLKEHAVPSPYLIVHTFTGSCSFEPNSTKALKSQVSYIGLTPSG